MHTFSPNTQIKSSQVNANFSGVADGTEIEDDAITTSHLSDNSVSVKKTKHSISTVSDGATVTFNLQDNNVFEVSLGGNRTLAVSNETEGQCFLIRLKQDSTGSRTVTWFSTIDWQDGTAPTLSTSPYHVDVFGFIVKGTDEYDGFIVGQDIDES